MIDGALHVEHGAQLLEGPDDAERDVGIADAHHTVAHRAEDRLDHDVAHRQHRRHRVGGPLADDGFGQWEPGLLQQRGRVELVDRALDGAGRVHDQHAALLDPVQRVDAKDRLLERSARNDPRQHGVGIEDLVTPVRQSAHRAPAAAEARHQPLVRQHPAGVPALGERPAQVVGMPTGTCAEDDYMHRCLIVRSVR